MSQPLDKKGRNLIVCNLPQCVGSDDLCDIFSKEGTVVSTKVMIDVKAGGHRGFGFVLFENADDAARAKDTFDGATVPGDPSKKFHVEFANHDAFNVVTDTAHIFVRNVPPTATNLDVVTYFTRFGEVVSCALRQDTARIGQPPTLAATMQFKEIASAKEAVANAQGATPFCDKSLPLQVKSAGAFDVRFERRLRQQRHSEPRDSVLPPTSSTAPPPLLAPVPGSPMPQYTWQQPHPYTAQSGELQGMQVVQVSQHSAPRDRLLIATPTGSVVVRPDRPVAGQIVVYHPSRFGQCDRSNATVFVPTPHGMQQQQVTAQAPNFMQPMPIAPPSQSPPIALMTPSTFNADLNADQPMDGGSSHQA